MSESNQLDAATLRAGVEAILAAARGDEHCECRTIRQWLNACGVFNDDIQGRRRLIEEACKVLLAEAPAPALVALVREWQEARKPAKLADPGVDLVATYQAAVKRMTAADEALAAYDLTIYNLRCDRLRVRSGGPA